MEGKISVIVPTYREKDNLTALVEQVGAALSGQNYELLLVDDDSRDGTAELAQALSAKHPLRLVVRQNERGLASAVVHGFKLADADTLAVMDADLQHPPHVLADMLKAIQSGADLVIASRYVPGGSCEGWSTSRRIISKGAIFLAHLLLPKTRKISDPMSGFFMLRKSVVSQANLKPSGYKILLEVLIEGDYQKAAEVPYRFRVREKGESKLSAKTQIDYLKHLFSLMKRTGEITRFVKFCLVGASGVGVNLGVFWVLTRFAGLHEEDFLALAIGIEVSILSNFTLNELFTFRDCRPPNSHFLVRLLKFNLFCLVGAGIQAGVYGLFYHVLGVYDLISNLIGIAVATLWNYFMNRRWTWQ